MFTATQLVAFVSAALVVLLIPGPGVLYVVARSLSQGSRAALMSALGLSVGSLLHVAAAIVGLSAILLSSATAFTLVKLAGAAYLIWLGLGMLRERLDLSDPATLPHRAPIRLFLDGVLISALNPKIALFFMAFLPQFISPQAGNPQMQILTLGLLYATLALVTDGGYGLFASTARHALRKRPRAGQLLKNIGGGLLITLGLKAALTRAS